LCIIDIEEAWLNTIEQAKLLANEYVKNVLMGTWLALGSVSDLTGQITIAKN